ncbi:MAG: anaerobic ribonucleoside-triphosphate reductase activating protein [Candidatus Ozemobacteraceae bacterium]
MTSSLAVGGLLRFTTIDFPGKLAAVIFLRGCNLRCSYCHNPELITSGRDEGLNETGNEAGEKVPDMSWKAVADFLKTRRGLLDGVVFSGGEPTLSPALYDAVSEVREMGFEVALHTNGCFPEKLEALLTSDLLSYVAMDVKAPFSGYSRITPTGEGKSARESAKMLIHGHLPHEFRTTVHPDLLDDEAVLELAEDLAGMGAKRFVLQPFHSGKTLLPGLSTPIGPFLRRSTIGRLEHVFSQFSVRGDPLRKIFRSPL